MPTRLVWLRRDLRLHDHPALTAAADGARIVLLYVLDDKRIGAAQRWWLHHSLAALDRALGGRLVLRRGPAAATVAAVADEIGADEIHATRLYEPGEIAAEAALGDRLILHDGETLIPPEAVTTGAGTPFKVYGAFWRALSERLPPPEPLPLPDLAFAASPASDRLDDWKLLPTRPNWAAGFGADWTPGEAGALDRLEEFADEAADYSYRRDRPGEEGTSRLSPHLHFGEVSPRTVWHRLGGTAAGAKYLKELAWRDFSRQALLAQPDLGQANGRRAMDRLRWRTGAAADADFIAWTRGLTGYPIVDAGMRQLWATGWMHNRVRMIAASLLVKHLLIDWRRGAAWFRDTLLDADEGNNALNWQWIAGTGTASQPFHRVMAPLAQSAKFDAADYIRRWVPELAELDDAAIHDPPLSARGDYPEPLIEHRAGRQRALDALAAAR